MTTGARLRLTVDYRAFLAKTQMARFAAIMLTTVERLVACQLARMHF